MHIHPRDVLFCFNIVSPLGIETLKTVFVIRLGDSSEFERWYRTLKTDKMDVYCMGQCYAMLWDDLCNAFGQSRLWVIITHHGLYFAMGHFRLLAVLCFMLVCAVAMVSAGQAEWQEGTAPRMPQTGPKSEAWTSTDQGPV